mmetsp:Transcript_103385/g.200313  ORF Transcript_103385/g.200313 Transcript_103385/m.200313 type:complete len:217 (-) Transcript_103385:993-1643(-)
MLFGHGPGFPLLCLESLIAHRCPGRSCMSLLLNGLWHCRRCRPCPCSLLVLFSMRCINFSLLLLALSCLLLSQSIGSLPYFSFYRCFFIIFFLCGNSLFLLLFCPFLLHFSFFLTLLFSSLLPLSRQFFHPVFFQCCLLLLVDGCFSSPLLFGCLSFHFFCSKFLLLRCLLLLLLLLQRPAVSFVPQLAGELGLLGTGWAISSSSSISSTCAGATT